MKGVHEKNDINCVILEPVGRWLTFTQGTIEATYYFRLMKSYWITLANLH